MKSFVLALGLLLPAVSFADAKPCSKLFSMNDLTEKERSPASVDDARKYINTEVANESDPQVLRFIVRHVVNASFANQPERDKQIQTLAAYLKRRVDLNKLTDCVE